MSGLRLWEYFNAIKQQCKINPDAVINDALDQQHFTEGIAISYYGDDNIYITLSN